MNTNAAANKGLWAPLAWASSVGLSIVGQNAGPGGYAELPFYLAANPEGVRYARAGQANLYDQNLSRKEISPNVAEAGVREKVWNKLASYF